MRDRHTPAVRGRHATAVPNRHATAPARPPRGSAHLRHEPVRAQPLGRPRQLQHAPLELVSDHQAVWSARVPAGHAAATRRSRRGHGARSRGRHFAARAKRADVCPLVGHAPVTRPLQRPLQRRPRGGHAAVAAAHVRSGFASSSVGRQEMRAERSSGTRTSPSYVRAARCSSAGSRACGGEGDVARRGGRHTGRRTRGGCVALARRPRGSPS